MNLFDLSGKVAVVSGAAQGMGQATALALAHAGADVALVDRNLEGANATAAEIQRRNLLKTGDEFPYGQKAESEAVNMVATRSAPRVRVKGTRAFT